MREIKTTRLTTRSSVKELTMPLRGKRQPEAVLWAIVALGRPIDDIESVKTQSDHLQHYLCKNAAGEAIKCRQLVYKCNQEMWWDILEIRGPGNNLWVAGGQPYCASSKRHVEGLRILSRKAEQPKIELVPVRRCLRQARPNEEH